MSWPFSCDYNFWLRDLTFGMRIKDSINKTCLKNGKDLSNGAPKIKLWNHTKITHFQVFAKNFRRPCMKLKKIFGQFPNPWTLRVSGMGGYTSKCDKKVKITAPYCPGSFSAYLLLAPTDVSMSSDTSDPLATIIVKNRGTYEAKWRNWTPEFFLNVIICR